MPLKKINLGVLFPLVLVLFIAFLLIRVWGGSSTEEVPTEPAQQVFTTKQDCQTVTRTSCTFLSCDYVPKGKSFKEVCGDDFQKGWVASQNPIISVAPRGEGEIIEYTHIPLEPDWLLKSNFNYSTYYGILNTQEQFDSIWQYVGSIKDELKGPNRKSTPDTPVAPEINFDEHSVIWFADRGKNASFTVLNSVTEFENLIEVEVTVFYSDFGSSDINIWKIPATEKPVTFVIKEKNDGGI